MNVIELFKKLLLAESVTPNDGGQLDFIEGYLNEFEAVRVDKNGVKNLFLSKKFGNGEHLSFMGHIDVVPAGDGWSSDPFEPYEENGYIYGRGAQDMKSGVAAMVQAFKEVKEFSGTLSMLLTSDEEGDAVFGTIEVLRYLEKYGMLPNYAVIGEPTCEENFGDAMKVGRRGSINGVIEKIGKQGHAAYPEKSTNPIHKVAQVLPSIAGVNLDEGDEFFSPSQLVITDIRAGMEVANVTPGKLKMMFNVRNSTKTTQDDIEEFVHKYFSGLKYTLTLAQSAKPFMTDVNSKIVKSMDSAIQSVTGLVPKHSTAGGTSDARFAAEFGIEVIEFGVKNDTIHAPNERSSAIEVEGLHRVYKELIDNF